MPSAYLSENTFPGVAFMEVKAAPVCDQKSFSSEETASTLCDESSSKKSPSAVEGEHHMPMDHDHDSQETLPCSDGDLRAELQTLVQQTLVAGEEYFVVDQVWWDQFQKSTQTVAIDNSKLVEKELDGVVFLKNGLLDTQDYILVPKAGWDKMVAVFGGGPAISRMCVSDGGRGSGMDYDYASSSSLIVEVFPLALTLITSDQDSKKVERLVSKRQTVGALKKQCCELFDVDEDQSRLWDFYDNKRYALLEDASATLDEARIMNAQTIMLEKKLEDGSWPKVETSSVSYTYGGSDGYGGTAEEKGATGLCNLGNTCFMNSSLQCLSNSPLLAEHFLSNRYQEEINRTNPIGMKGELAEQFASLLQELWKGTYTSYSPRDFKWALSRFAPQFSGYQQHDSQELLAFLLDGLHEDLNRVKTKPSVEPVEGGTRPDHEVAEESWQNHLARNDSMLVDTFHGQYKSTVECDNEDCRNVSVTFDPFMYLSLPIGNHDKQRTLEVKFVPFGSVQASTLSITVPKFGTIGDLRASVAESESANKDRLVFTEIYWNDLYKTFKDSEELTEIGKNDTIVAFEVENAEVFSFVGSKTSLRSLDDSHTHAAVVIIQQRPQRKNVWDSLTYKMVPSDEFEWKPKGQPLLLSVPRDISSGAHLYQMVRSMFGDRNVPAFNLKTAGTYLASGHSIADDPSAECPTLRHGERINLDWAEDEEEPSSAEDQRATAMQTEPGSVTLGQCLEMFTTQEKLSEHDTWYCPKCKSHRQALKKFDLWKLPKLLVVHLKRFDYNRYSRDKVDTLVDFPLEGFDLAPYLLNNKLGSPTVYDLYAVSNHFGGLGGGHYTAFAQNPNSKVWYDFNDSRVEKVTEVSAVKSAAAYVLFYRRRDV
jgi:ubiquitin carboxyl-terminal hydrolase 4/11/15